MKLYIVKSYTTSETIGVYASRKTAKNECEKLNNKYIKPLYCMVETELIEG